MKELSLEWEVDGSVNPRINGFKLMSDSLLAPVHVYNLMQRNPTLLPEIPTL